MNPSEFVIAVRIYGVWRVARASKTSRTCFAGIGRSPATAFNKLFAAVRRAA